MKISIRDYIKNNFKDSSETDIKDSIESAIKEGDEVSLPGLGVLLEILWNNSDENVKKTIIQNIKQGL